jgi:hypothetical protein
MSSLRFGRNRQLTVGAPCGFRGTDNDMRVKAALSLKTVLKRYRRSRVAP